MTIKVVKTVLRILAMENENRQAVKDVIDYLTNAVNRSDVFPNITEQTGADAKEIRALKLVAFLRGYNYKECELLKAGVSEDPLTEADAK